MEKPIRIGPLCGARVVPAVEVSCDSFTQDALSRRQNRTNIFLIAHSFAPLLYQKAAVEVEPLTRRFAPPSPRYAGRGLSRSFSRDSGRRCREAADEGAYNIAS